MLELVSYKMLLSFNSLHIINHWLNWIITIFISNIGVKFHLLDSFQPSFIIVLHQLEILLHLFNISIYKLNGRSFLLLWPSSSSLILFFKFNCCILNSKSFVNSFDNFNQVILVFLLLFL